MTHPSTPFVWPVSHASSALHPPVQAVQCALLGDHGRRMLIGACTDPMLNVVSKLGLQGWYTGSAENHSEALGQIGSTLENVLLCPRAWQWHQVQLGLALCALLHDLMVIMLTSKFS